jgi:hypothetical protein
MSQVTLCDLCEWRRVEQGGERRLRLQTAGEVHPHKGERLPHRMVDVCEGCLDLMLGFFVFPELEGLQRMVQRARREADLVTGPAEGEGGADV